MDILQIIAAFLASALGAGTILRFSAEKLIESRIEKVVQKEMLLTETDLNYRQRQLEEFYGPIYASLKLNDQIYNIWNTPENVLADVNQDVIDLFIQNNAAIIEILKTKAHLMDGATFPPEFVEYMTSTTLWGLYCQRPDQPWIPEAVKTKLAPQIAWPENFEKYIYEKTETLKQELDSLLIKYRAK
ncbi:MAG: hypothetical protein AAGG51_21810 [Cyanobacteria bacterium P01_G01_bin.54]